MLGRLIVFLFLTFLMVFQARPTLAQKTPSEPSQAHLTMKGPYPDGVSVTKACLKCHQDKGEEILLSSHWLWKGPSPFVLGHEKDEDLGKINLLNNF